MQASSPRRTGCLITRRITLSNLRNKMRNIIFKPKKTMGGMRPCHPVIGGHYCCQRDTLFAKWFSDLCQQVGDGSDWCMAGDNLLQAMRLCPSEQVIETFHIMGRTVFGGQAVQCIAQRPLGKYHDMVCCFQWGYGCVA